jgi:hypothetical protein
MRFFNLKTFVIFALITLAWPFFSNAATLYIAPESKDVRVGDVFSVLVGANSQGVAINAATADITFDNNLLSVQSVGFSNSIFTVWPEEPSYSNINGNIHFSGGIYSPGWNGSAGTVLRISFKAKALGQVKLAVENASVLANDGIGTNVLNSNPGSVINVSKALPIIETKKSATTSATTTIVNPEVFLVPVITNLPNQLTEGSILSFAGNAISDGQMLLYIQKGKNNPEITQLDIKSSSRFDYAYKDPVTSGYYKIWARNILPGGVMATSSDVYYVEVVNPNTVNLIGHKLTYKSIISLLVLVSVTLLVFWVVTLLFYLKITRKKTVKNSLKK